MSRRGGTGRGGDFGESFVEKERQYRYRKTSTLPSRAKSEAAEVMSYGNGGKSREHRQNFYRTANASFQSEVPSSYARPRSSFEPASSSSAAAAARVLRTRPDDWMEVQRRLPQNQHNNVNNSSEEEEGNSDVYGEDEDDSRDELSNYNFRPIQEPTSKPNYYSNNKSFGYGRGGASNSNGGRRSLMEFDDREVYYFGVVQLSLDRARTVLSTNPPPMEYRTLNPIERTAYLYYFTLYRKYLTPVTAFRNVFNREFYKYTCEGCSEDVALWKICKHTQEEYKQKVVKRNQEAYKMSQKHLFSDERETPDSR